MYKRGKITTGSRATAIAAGIVVTASVFSLVSVVNQLKMNSGPAVGGLSAITTAPLAKSPSDRGLLSSIRTAGRELRAIESEPFERSQRSQSVVTESPKVEMPVLENIEISDEAHLQFVFDVDDLDLKPTPYYRKSPIYPVQLSRDRIEGKVVAEFRVDREGHTYGIRITESDHSDFSASVVDALLQWRFMPGRVDGELVEFRMRIPMKFRVVASRQKDPDAFIASLD